MTTPAAPDSIEGRIDIALSTEGDCVVDVRIQSSRPQISQRLLGGRRADDVPGLVGMLFSLCGQAQRMAAETAIEAARLADASVTTLQQRARLAMAERVREHAWRFLVDWPRQMGLPVDTAALARLRTASDPAGPGAALPDLLQNTLLGEPAADWLARGTDDLQRWMQTGCTPTARLLACLAGDGDPGTAHSPLLPDMDRANIAILARQALDTPEFCSRPEWRGSPAETGALARQQAQPLVAAWLARRGRGSGARMLARLAELAQCAVHPDLPPHGVLRAWPLGDSLGAAGVETSRGLLLHVVRLQGDRIADYRIIAPTEWNFHPAGPLAEGLARLPADARLEERARLLVQSLDPCVAHGITLREA